MAQETAKLIMIKREPAIMVPKEHTVERLTNLLAAEDKENFKALCTKIENTINKRNEDDFKDLKILHSKYFHPSEAYDKFKDPEKGTVIEKYEENFLTCFREIMRRSNFNMLSKKEWEEAKRSKYLLRFNIDYDKSKLDSDLLRRFTNEDDMFDHQFLIYHRGVGLDKTKGYFFMAKLAELRKSIFKAILSLFKTLRNLGKSSDSTNRPLEERCDEKVDFIERVHVEDVKIRNFFQQVQLQEPTFSQVIVLYRLKNEDYKYGIHIKQFKDIPMADLEIVLPMKTTPRLRAVEWAKLAAGTITAIVALWESFKRRSENETSNLKLGFAILAAVLGYSFKVYYTFHTNVLEYQKLISKVVYEKQRDTGPATLAYLYENVLHQEVNETVVAYFVLLLRGKATEKELQSRCDDVLKRQFDKSCDFEVSDAIKKLKELKLADENQGYWECWPLQQALERIEN